MGQFTYEIPNNFNTRIIQFLQQKGRTDLSNAFQHCEYEYEDVGNAFYAGIKGDNWNMNALDFTFEGSEKNIKLLDNNKSLIKDIIGKALRSRESGLQVRDIYCLVSDVENELLPKTREERLNADMSSANTVLNDLVWIGERVCTNVAYNESTKENTFNDYFRDMLCGKGYSETKDQTRHGISASGKDAGEIDLLLSKDGKEIAIIEAIKLNNVNSNTINAHIEKAINNYNPLGTATFIVAYVSNDDFSGFWERYFAYLKDYSFSLTVKENISIRPDPNASTRVARCILSKDNYDFPVFFIALNIRK